MPRVPTLDTFGVRPSTGPDARFASPEVNNYGPSQTAQAGQALGQAAELRNKFAVDVAEEANLLRVDDAMNQAKEAANRLTYDKDVGFTHLKGREAFTAGQGEGKNLADTYGDTLRKELDGIGETLGNERQRQAFARASGNLMSQFKGSATKHEGEQSYTYYKSVRQATVQTNLRDIALNYANPEATDKALQALGAASNDLGRLEGMSAEWIQANTRRVLSHAHTVAMDSAIENNNLAFVDKYLEKYKDGMEADDILRVQAKLTKEKKKVAGLTASDEIIREAAPTLAPTSVDKAWNITKGTESNNRQFDAKGQPLRSTLANGKPGAVGIAQVMEGTGPEAAKLAGLPWDRNRWLNDATYNEAIGKAYFQKQLKTYNGDLSKAWAAYNAGPGRLDAALKSAEKDTQNGAFRGGQPDELYWLTKMPDETQKYVAKNLKAYAANEGTPKRATLEDLQARARATIKDPDVLHTTLDDLARRYTVMGQASKQHEDDATAEIHRALVANGGDYWALPTSMRNSAPPGKTDDFLNFGKKIAEKRQPETDWGVYYALKANPQRLAGENLMAWRDKFADAEFKKLVEDQEDLRKGGGDKGGGVRDVRAVLNNLMVQAGADPTPKDDDKKGAAVVGRVLGAYEDRLRDMKSVIKREPTFDEKKKLAAEMFQQVDVVRGFMGLSFNKTTDPLKVTPGQQVIVPEATAKALAAAFKARGVNATPDQIEAAYREGMGIVPRSK